METETKEIPFDRWPAFFEQFSRAHRGQASQVRTADTSVGFQANAQDLPFIGVLDERPGASDESIRVMLGSSGGTHIDHAVHRPAHVRVAEWNDGFSAALQIEAADGSMTLIQVGPPEHMLPPDMVTDGLWR